MKRYGLVQKTSGRHCQIERTSTNGYWGDMGDGTYRNPIIAADFSDPDPIRVGDDFTW